jgi:hypothetical protein
MIGGRQVLRWYVALAMMHSDERNERDERLRGQGVHSDSVRCKRGLRPWFPRDKLRFVPDALVLTMRNTFALNLGDHEPVSACERGLLPWHQMQDSRGVIQVLKPFRRLLERVVRTGSLLFKASQALHIASTTVDR